MAYSRASVTGKISAPAEKVWEQIGSFANIKPIMQGAITDCAVDRTGTIRKLKVKGAKGLIAERLLKYDGLTYTQIYTIIDKPNNIVPFLNYTATIRVKPLTSRSCSVVWSSRFEPKKGQTVEGCREFACGIYETGIGGVKKRVVMPKTSNKSAKKLKKRASGGRKKVAS